MAQLNLAGMPDLIKVLSGRTETVASSIRLRARVRQRPRRLAAALHGEDARHELS